MREKTCLLGSIKYVGCANEKKFEFFLGDMNEERLEHFVVIQTRHFSEEDSAMGSVAVGLGCVAWLVLAETDWRRHNLLVGQG